MPTNRHDPRTDTGSNTDQHTGERVIATTDGPIAHVTLNRPAKLNALDLNMLHELAVTARKLRRNRHVRAVVLSGAGPSFSAGLDFGSVGQRPGQMIASFLRPPWRATNLFQEACWAWRRLPIPVIAGLRGHCFGGGLQLALGADFRFATPDCQLSIMEAKWGLVPDMGGTVSLRELLPLDTAKRLAMTGEVFNGSHAKEIGLITETANDPIAAATDLAQQIAKRSPDAVAATKLLLHKAWSGPRRGALRLERAYQLRLLLGANHKIARQANAKEATPEFVRRTLNQ